MITTWLLDTLRADPDMQALVTGGYYEQPLVQLLPGQDLQVWHTAGAFTNDGIVKPSVVCLPVGGNPHPQAAFMGMKDYYPRLFFYASTWDGALVVQAMRQLAVQLLAGPLADDGKQFVQPDTGTRYRVVWVEDGQGAREAQEYERTLFDWVRLRVTTQY